MGNNGNTNTATISEKPAAKKAGPGKGQGPSFASPRNLVLIALVVVLGLGFGIYHLIQASHFESTDNAYLTADVVQIAPQVSAVVKEVKVKENQQVKAGDLLVVLDDSMYRAAVEQRQADLSAAMASAKGAGVNVNLIEQQGNAQIMTASGGVEQADSGIASARAEVARSESAVKNAAATSMSYSANVGAMEAAVNTAVVAKNRLKEAVSAAEAQLESSRATVKSAEANVDSAQAGYDRAAHDLARYITLTNQGAASKQTLDQIESTARSAKAQLESAKEQVSSAKAVVAQKQADLSAAKEQLNGADYTIAQAKAQLSAARAQVAASKEGVHQAEAQRALAMQSVSQAMAKKQQALGQLTSAQTAPTQVGVGKSAKDQALAKVAQARAALNAAKLQLSYTKIYAPVDGRVSKKTVEVGALVQPGTPLMAMVVQGNLWIAANYKETQLGGIKPGCEAEVRVDAVPGHVFKAHVDSLSAATGSTFALLPPDNATGNFTKVVQRLPVKITIDPGQPDMDRLSAGMSVIARVKKG